jgi:hypothetical protein
VLDGAVELLQRWHRAVNRGDADEAASLSSADVEVGGPRGAARGREVLHEWVRHAGINLEPVNFFARDETVVVAQAARWKDPDSGELGPAQTAASVFVVHRDCVSSVRRYEDLDAALSASGLSRADAVDVPGA